MGDETNSAAVTAGPPPTADVQDPLPESNWKYRRWLVFGSAVLTSIALAVILVMLYGIARQALQSSDTANGAQISLQAIEALYGLAFWLFVLTLADRILYLIAPSAEQATKMLATVQAWKAGISTAMTARVATPTSRAETSTVTGPALPAAAEPAPASPAVAEPTPAAPAEPASPAAPVVADPPPPAVSIGTRAEELHIEPARPTALDPAPSAAGMPPPIAMVSVDLLRVACPTTTREDLALFVEPIRKACLRFEINTVRRVAAFIAQQAHESGDFRSMGENLNYTAKRLTQVWPGRFPSLAAAQPYARNPEKLANKVYANRMGNGSEASGDGWRFRGGGPLQLTGRDNWTRFAKAMGMKLEEALLYGRTPEGGVMAAAWFWEANDINRLADTPGVADESRRINGGTTGLADRAKKFDALVRRMLQLEKAA